MVALKTGLPLSASHRLLVDSPFLQPVHTYQNEKSYGGIHCKCHLHHLDHIRSEEQVKRGDRWKLDGDQTCQFFLVLSLFGWAGSSGSSLWTLWWGQRHSQDCSLLSMSNSPSKLVLSSEELPAGCRQMKAA